MERLLVLSEGRKSRVCLGRESPSRLPYKIPQLSSKPGSTRQPWDQLDFVNEVLTGAQPHALVYVSFVAAAVPSQLAGLRSRDGQSGP